MTKVLNNYYNIIDLLIFCKLLDAYKFLVTSDDILVLKVTYHVGRIWVRM